MPLNPATLRCRLAALLLLPCCAVAAAATPSFPGAGDLWFNADAEAAPAIELHFFWSRRCPHCLQAQPFIESLQSRYAWLHVRSYELYDTPSNRDTFRDMAALLGETAASVPTFMFCGKMLVGWSGSDSEARAFEDALQACYRQVYGEPGSPQDGPAPAATTAPAVELPLFGTLQTEQLSLPVLTLVLAGLDAFNPCAFFVLLFLLSMLVHTRSRRVMLLVGGVFVLVSGLVYFAFMALWLNMFLVMGEIGKVTLLAALIAIGIALVNIKDYFRFREGVSLSLSDSQKHSLAARIRGLLGLRSIPALLAGTVLLALVANMYELLCTAGFPMVYTRILTLNAVSPGGYYLYLVFYNVVYVLPLLLITALYIVTLGSRRLKESEGRFLKLLSGLMMLELGLLLLFMPERLGSLLTAAALLLTALAGAVLIAVTTRALRRR